jgi:exodeoxyribonuclease V alpha subunit
LVIGALDIAIDVWKRRGVQILTATRHGVLGSSHLAAVTASQLHPANRDEASLSINDCGLVIGDQLIASRTLKDWSITNGQTYIITSIDTDRKTVRLDSLSKPIPWRLVQFFQFTHSLTVHRHQMIGDPRSVAIIVLDNRSDFLMTREWLYTALSFATERCLIVGYRPALEQCLSSSARSGRDCALLPYLQSI